MKHSANYPSTRHRDPHTQSTHDRAFFNTLLLLIGICVIVIVIGKATGYSQSDASMPKTKTAPVAPVAPVVKPVTEPKPGTAAAPAPKPAPPEFAPTESEYKDGRILQQDAIIARYDWNAEAQRLPSYQVFSAKIGLLTNWCKQVIARHKWPKEVTCNIDKNPIVFGMEQAAQTTQAAQGAQGAQGAQRGQERPATATATVAAKP